MSSATDSVCALRVRDLAALEAVDSSRRFFGAISFVVTACNSGQFGRRGSVSDGGTTKDALSVSSYSFE